MAKKDQDQGTLLHLAKMQAYDRNQLIMNTVVADAARQILGGVDNDKAKLVVKDIRVVQKHDNNDKTAQQDVRNQNGTWADELRAEVEVIDKATGKTADKATLKIADVPKLTDRHTYIIGGNEYQFTTQARLKPGVYTKTQNNGEISSFFNVDKTIDFDRGFNNNFKITFAPADKAFWLQYGQKNIPLITALRALGKTDADIRKDLGDEIYQANSHKYDRSYAKDLNKFHQAVFGKLPESGADSEAISKSIRERLFATKLDKETTALTLGRPYENVNGQAITDAVKKIIDIHKGKTEGDERDSLIFKSFVGPEDIVRESLVKNAKNIQSNIGYRLGKTLEIRKSMSSATLSPFVSGVMVTSKLSNPPGQVNVLSTLGEGSKVTIMGEGGIGSANAISDEARQISNTDMGFIDPLHTPEGGNIGVVNHLSNNTVRVGKEIYSAFHDARNNGKAMLRPIDVYHKTVAFPDEYSIKNGKADAKSKTVKAVRAGKLVEVKPGEVDYVLPKTRDMFDYAANAIPFLGSIQGNRGLTASKMQEQALPLVHRDAPLFKIVDEDGIDIHEEYGKAVGVPRSPVDGEVVSVHNDKIVIKDHHGKPHDIGLYHNFSLNSESFLHNTATVKPGDKVSANQVLAESNNTKDGRLSLGTNLKVAYMPYRGYNYEDSTIIGESAAKKLTSEHIYDFKTRRSANGVFSRDKYKAFYPEQIDKRQASKLGADGVIRVGEEVEHGDTLIAHLEHRAPSADDLAMKRLDRQTFRDMADHGIRWEAGHKGVVTSVETKGKDVVVSVKTAEPVVVGDKISGLHGNKHIVSAIVPDHEMPFNPATGEHIDITMSPIGVVNRINTSQILENAAGKLALKTGQPYVVKQFGGGDNTRELMAEMKKHGVEHKDVLVDPKTGHAFKEPVANGISHILKLEHKVDHKFSARYREGHDSNEQAVSGGETGGKNLGRMEIAALLARGAYANLDEMFNVKGQRNDEFWRAIETGQTPPPPKGSFAWGKFEAMMRGAGVNTVKNGKTIGLLPLTDKDISELSSGRLDNAIDTYRKKDLAPIKGGLFDPVKAGGMQGEKYTHFDLPEPILNPAMEDAATAVLGITGTQLQDVIKGRKFVDAQGKMVEPGTAGATSGGPGLKRMLEQVDVKAGLAEAVSAGSQTKDSTKLNKLNRKAHYLKTLDEKGMKPTDYLISKVLVIPSKFRPMFAMGTDNTVIMSDVNYLYQQAASTVDAFHDIKKTITDASGDHKDLVNAQLAQIRGGLYDDVKAVTGFGDPSSFLNKQKGRKGFMSLIDGGDKQTKEGYFQDKVMARRQDLVGRSTITLNPDLGADEMGIPKLMAKQIFQPFIMEKLVGWGYTPLEAKKQIEDGTSVFVKARDAVVSERLIIANRAPTLHRYNMTAMHPKLTDGKTIEVPSIVISKNWSGDFDGDSALTLCMIVCNLSEIISQYNKNDVSLGEEIDSCVGNDYIDFLTGFFNQRRVSMPALEKIYGVSTDDEVFCVHLKDFPRLAHTKSVQKNGNEDYDVPKGISIFTVDNETHKPVLVPVTKYSVHKDLDWRLIELSDRNSLSLSADQSAIAVNTESWQLERITPDTLTGRAIPRVRDFSVDSKISEISLQHFSNRANANSCVERIVLDRQFGHWIGMMVGNGWVDMASSICMASVHKNLQEDFTTMISRLLTRDFTTSKTENPHDFDGFASYSEKVTVSSRDLSPNVKSWIGSGAKNKHLPGFFFGAPKEFQLGLLAGLMDSDGTVTWSYAKGKKPQFIMSYSTTSERLADEIVLLSRLLGVPVSITTVESKGEYRLSFSTQRCVGLDLDIHNEDKRKAWFEFQATGGKTSNAMAGRLDHVPFSKDLYSICKKFVRCSLHMSEYNAINDSKDMGCATISRMAAKKLMSIDYDNTLPKAWIDIVNNEDITWVYAKSVTNPGNSIDMYDITAPGPYTFMIANGVIVQDTFQIHTPIGVKAMAEAKKMLPSQSALKHGFDTPLNTPDQDILAGAWLASMGRHGVDKTALKFETEHDLENSVKDGRVDDVDTVVLNGVKATAGMHLVNSVLPAENRDHHKELNKKNVNNWLADIAIKHGDSMSVAVADKMKEVGNRAVTTHGLTLGIEDTVSEKGDRETFLDVAKQHVGHTAAEATHAYHTAKTALMASVKARLGDNTPLGVGLASGGSKGIDQIININGMPGILADAHNKPIPMPVTNSYSEGLTGFGYWAAAHGARSGNIQKSVSSFKPGWLTKDLINSIYSTKISGDSAMDTEGLEYDVDNSKALANRFLARDVVVGKHVIAHAGDHLDSKALHAIKKSGAKTVHVMSPLTDPTSGDSFSAMSYGTDHKGVMPTHGTDIGVISAHTITEPSLNMAMKAFHTGGVFTGKTKTAFDILDQTMRFTHIPDKAAMASMNGKVSKIHRSSVGGYDVDITGSNGESETLYVHPNNSLKIGDGAAVVRGQVLDTGDVDVHDVVKHQGMKSAQRFLVDKISGINNGELDRRDIEVLVRGITNTTRVMADPLGKYIPGDLAATTAVEHDNKTREDGMKVHHEPFLMPMGIAEKSAVGKDWLARMAHTKIRNVVSRGAAQGWESDISGQSHPIPMLVAGGYQK